MPTLLLTTKLYIPLPRPNLISRPRLIERLDEGLCLGRRLTLIAAPAGFGKTTLLSEWVAGCGRPEPVVRFAWVSLDRGDNDPARFWAYFIAALQGVQTGIGEATLAMLQSPKPLPAEAFLTDLINEITAASLKPFALVLDDYHLIKAQPIHNALTFLLDHLPPNLHLVIATRADPPLPLARLRARDQLTELCATDLRFSSSEAAEFLNQVMGLGLTGEDVATLETRTEGWIAGLQMAALSMRGRKDVTAFIRTFSGSHRFILDYLAEEVLDRQPSDIQEFLLKTCILERMTTPLCDAVLSLSTSADSQRILEYLEHDNLFVVPLDDERRWYRYHRLFADLLRQRLQREKPELVPEMHRRAGEWYEQNGLIAEAGRHALAAGDFERAARLIERAGWEMLMRGACLTLLGWIDAFPDSFVRSRPRLGVIRAWCLAVTGQIDRAESCLSNVDVQQMQGKAAAVRAYAASVRGNARHGIAFAQQALEQLPEDNLLLRGFLTLNLGIAYSSSGEPEAASRALNQAIELSRVADQIDLTLAATATLGHVQDNQAMLRQAVETHRRVLDLARDLDGQPAPVVGMAYLGIAEVLYEWNDLDGALCHVTKGLKLLELGHFVTYLLFGHSLRARVCLARRVLDGAQTAIQQAERLAQDDDFAYMMAVLGGLRARLSLAQGDAAAAARWAQTHRWTDEAEIDRACEAEQMAVAWVLVAQDRAGEAMHLLARLLEAAQTAGRIENTIKILTLQALAFQAQHNLDGALSSLEQALLFAEPEGYVRTFLDEGEPMARLLRCALSRGVAPNYVARLLAAFGEEVEPASPAVESLIEPLSEREIQVLRLVTAGLSNPEIAQELFIAVSTVKSHINHIYGKLDVRSRTQAAARARELNLL